jgi:hypothetical protein
MPSLSGSTTGTTSFSALQEQYAVWNKLSSAVSRESLYDLKQALESASSIILSDTSRAILLTYCDALTRQQNAARWSTDEVVKAVERGSYERALDMVIEIATTHGAEAGLLLSWLTRLCADWNARKPAANPPATSYNELVALATANGNGHKKKAVDTEDVGSLVLILERKAARNARLELNKVWDALDSAYDPSTNADKAGDKSGGIGPSYSPFSRQEELFFIRNKIVSAIFEQSLVELRRALAYAMAFGVQPESIEIEAAYRDALAAHQQADGFSPSYVRTALEEGDWWSAFDTIIGVALARGVNASRLQRTIGTYQSRASQQCGVPLPQERTKIVEV